MKSKRENEHKGAYFTKDTQHIAVDTAILGQLSLENNSMTSDCKCAKISISFSVSRI